MEREFLFNPWAWFVNIEFFIGNYPLAVSEDYSFFPSFQEANEWSNKFLETLGELALELDIELEVLESDLNGYDLGDRYSLMTTSPEAAAREFFSDGMRSFLKLRNTNGGRIFE